MTSKYRRGFEIARDSLHVFTRRPRLLLLPGLSFAFLLVALPGVALGAIGYFRLDGAVAAGALVGGGAVVVAALVGSQTASAVVRTALYRHATTGEQVGPFDARDPDSVFSER